MNLLYIFILTQRKSQINLSWVKLKYAQAISCVDEREGEEMGL